MDQKLEAGSDRVYEDFTPYYEWARDEGSIIVLLPGYRRDQVKVQVTSKPVLKLMGERQIIGNRWSRLNIEFPLPSDYDTDNVTAKFESFKLYIKFAKLDNPKEPTNPLVEDPNPNKEPSQKVDQKNANNEVSDQKTPQKEKEKSKTEETEAASIDKMAQKNGLTETTEASSIDKMAQKNSLTETKVAPTKVSKPVSRSKTRLLDFTLSLGPSNNQAHIDNEDLGDLESRINKRKKLVKGVMLILLAVVLGFYARNAFRHSSIGSKFQEL